MACIEIHTHPTENIRTHHQQVCIPTQAVFLPPARLPHTVCDQRTRAQDRCHHQLRSATAIPLAFEARSLSLAQRGDSASFLVQRHIRRHRNNLSQLHLFDQYIAKYLLHLQHHRDQDHLRHYGKHRRQFEKRAQ